MNRISTCRPDAGCDSCASRATEGGGGGDAKEKRKKGGAMERAAATPYSSHRIPGGQSRDTIGRCGPWVSGRVTATCMQQRGKGACRAGEKSAKERGRVGETWEQQQHKTLTTDEMQQQGEGGAAGSMSGDARRREAGAECFPGTKGGYSRRAGRVGEKVRRLVGQSYLLVDSTITLLLDIPRRHGPTCSQTDLSERPEDIKVAVEPA